MYVGRHIQWVCLNGGVKANPHAACSDAGAPQDGYAAALKSTTLTVMNALLEGHVNLQKGKSTLVQPAVASVAAVIAMLEAQ